MRFPTMLTVGLLAATVACGPNRPDYEDQADKALASAGLSDVNSNYDDDANVVHLTGSVATDAERQRAQDVVERVVAPGAMVANEVTVASNGTDTIDGRPAGTMDSQISDRLDQMVDQDAALAHADVDFDVKNGVVTITGEVPSADAKQHVEEMARNQPGVNQVVNSLEINTKTAERR